MMLPYKEKVDAYIVVQLVARVKYDMCSMTLNEQATLDNRVTMLSLT